VQKHPSNKPMSPSFSNDQYRHHDFSSHIFDSSERSKSEISVTDSQQRFKIESGRRRPSLDSASRHRTPQTPFTSAATTSFIDTDGIEEESKCQSLFSLKKQLSYRKTEMFSESKFVIFYEKIFKDS
jgi:hypothetical protein